MDPADGNAYALATFVARYGGSAAAPPPQWQAAEQLPSPQDVRATKALWRALDFSERERRLFTEGLNYGPARDVCHAACHTPTHLPTHHHTRVRTTSTPAGRG